MSIASLFIACTIVGALVPTILRAKPDYYTLAGPTLGEGLPLLGAHYRRELRAGPNAAERRIALFPLDRPLAEVEKQLSRFVPHKPGTALWYDSGNVRLFEEDIASRNARLAAAEKRRQLVAQHIAENLAQAVQWAQPRPGDDRILATSRARARSYQGIIAGFPQRKLREALAGIPTSAGYQELTPRAQELLRNRVAGYEVGEAGRAEPIFDGNKDYVHTRVELEPVGPPHRPGFAVNLHTGSYGGLSFGDVIHTPELVPSEGWDWADHGKSYRERSRHPPGLEKVRDLQQRISVERGRIEAVLAEIAERSGLALIGEYDPCFERRPSAPDAAVAPRPGFRQGLGPDEIRELPLWQAMDRVAVRFDLDWDYQDGWLWVRSPRTLLSWSGEADLTPPTPEFQAREQEGAQAARKARVRQRPPGAPPADTPRVGAPLK